jgi:hypothetical protein
VRGEEEGQTVATRRRRGVGWVAAMRVESESQSGSLQRRGKEEECDGGWELDWFGSRVLMGPALRAETGA